MQPEKAVAEAPLAQPPADTPSKLPSSTKNEPSVEETVLPKKRVLHDKKHITSPVVEPSFSEEKVPGHQGDSVVSGVAVEVASVHEGVHADTPNSRGPPQEHQRGQDAIVYARPKYKQNPLPHYPEVARRRGYEGRALLRIEVLESGKVGQVEIATSSGFEVLDRAALGSVKAWAFVPGTKNGEKIAQWVMVPIRFSLR